MTITPPTPPPPAAHLLSELKSRQLQAWPEPSEAGCDIADCLWFYFVILLFLWHLFEIISLLCEDQQSLPASRKEKLGATNLQEN